MSARIIRAVCCALTVATGVTAAPAPAEPGNIRVILVGDSTMATRTGYGDALCRTLQPAAHCDNLAKGGRSSASYRGEGSWEQVMNLLRDPDFHGTSYVLIQFGHNDQPGKPGRSTDLAREFPVNLERYVSDVENAGGKPILVTPLTRRIFRDGVLDNNLLSWADAARAVAHAKHVPVLELNADSAAAVAAMGSLEADTLAVAPPPKPGDDTQAAGSKDAKFDYTHLGDKGAAYFARMVERELAQAVPLLAPYLSDNYGK